MKKLLAPLFALSLLVGLSGLIGCHGASATTPATAPDPYQKAGYFMLSLSQDILSTQQIIDSLHAGKVIDNATYIKILMSIKQVDAYGKQIDALIVAQAGAASIKDRVNSALTAVTGITSVTSGLDDQNKARIAGSVALIQAVFQNVLLQFTLATSEVHVGPTRVSQFSGAGISLSSSNLQPVQGGWSARPASYISLRRSRRQLRQILRSSGYGHRGSASRGSHGDLLVAF